MKKPKASTVIIFILLLIIIIGFASEKMSKGNSGSGSNNGSSNITQALVGKAAPDFTLTDLQGNIYNNDNLKGKRVVLFFNEGLMCYPACWNQMMEFPKDKRFAQDDVVVLSVVLDSKESWQKAIEKMPEMGQVKAAIDTSGTVSNDFHMLNLPSSMHTGSLPGHTYVVMDRDGIIRYVFDDPKMAINNGTIYSEIEKLK